MAVDDPSTPDGVGDGDGDRDHLRDAEANAHLDQIALGPRLRLPKRVLVRLAQLFTHRQAAYNRSLIEAERETRQRADAAAQRADAVAQLTEVVGERLDDGLASIQTALTDLQTGVEDARTDAMLSAEQVAVLFQGLEKLGQRIDDVERSISRLTESHAADRRELRVRSSILEGIARDLRRARAETPSPSTAPDAFDDELYAEFEEAFRGSPEEIRARLSVYLPDVAAIPVDGPAVDLGCGRGEWLDLLREAGVDAYGVDTNRLVVERATTQGRRVIEADALTHLRSLPDESTMLVSAFHLIEHLPFNELVSLVDEALRVLRPGGLLLIESPNAGTISVGGSRFFLDPTHIKPVLPELMDFLLRQRGFRDVEIRPLLRDSSPLAWPTEPSDVMEAMRPATDALDSLLFGAEDYGALATPVGSGRLQLAVWTPLPPQPSGIADYNRTVLPVLAESADVTVVVDDHVLPDLEPLPLPVVGRSEFLDSGAVDRVDLNVFHMGNHPMHSLIHDAAIEHPGLVALHDASLLDFYWVRCGGDGPALEAEIRSQEGEDAIDCRDRLQMPMVRRLIQASRGAVVHSAWLHDRLARAFPHRPVFHVPLAAPPPPDDAGGAAWRASLGWAPRDVVFGALGAMAHHKRLDLTVRIFAALHALRPRARLLIAGRVLYPEVCERVLALGEELSLGDALRVIGDADSAMFDACLDATDVMVDFRWPTAGEMPATLMRALAASVPALVTDLPQLRQFDELAVGRVPTEAAACARHALAAMAELCDHPLGRAQRGAHAKAEGELASIDRVADGYLAAALAVAVLTRPSTIPETRGQPGCAVTAIGDYRAATGLAVAGRRLAAALVDVGVAVTRSEFQNPHAPHHERVFVEPLRSLPDRRDNDLELWFLNFNEFTIVDEDVLRPPGTDRYVIGSWFWEAPVLTAIGRDQLARVDEVWVPSRYVRDTFGAHSTKPVTVIPPVVDVPAPGRSTRRDFGIPEDAFCYFFSFDANSTAARKNPSGVIDAFARAFEPSERRRARLVVKVSNLEHHEDLRRVLEPSLAAVGGILLEHDLSRSEMNDLLASIDVYVSLHRSEGFGLGLAESMFLGKPVIATAYSGNVDFTTRANSCLVGYQLRTIVEDDHRLFPPALTIYEPGLVWAEPDVGQAATWMRRLFERPELRRRLGAAGAATIRRRFQPEAIGRRAWRRLDEIAATRQRRA